MIWKSKAEFMYGSRLQGSNLNVVDTPPLGKNSASSVETENKLIDGLYTVNSRKTALVYLSIQPSDLS